MRIVVPIVIVLSACAGSRPVAPMGTHGAHGKMEDLHRDFDRYVGLLDDPARAEWQKPDELVAALRILPGQAVADIGAGTGYFTFRLARAVGPKGKVYAVDVDERMIHLLKKRREEAGTPQVGVVKTPPEEPGLPPRSVDLVFLCDTYHHLGDRAAWLRKLKAALRPGGRFVDIDFRDGPMAVGPPPGHKLEEKVVREEIARAGFRLVGEPIQLRYQYVLVYEVGEAP